MILWTLLMSISSYESHYSVTSHLFSLNLSSLLSRLTAQRSIEDAEEVERERRRRAREASRWSNGGSLPGDVSPESETPAEENM